MDSDFEFIICIITRLVNLNNIIGAMNTITAEDTYFLQRGLILRLKFIEDELGIRKEDFVALRAFYADYSDMKYIRIDE